MILQSCLHPLEEVEFATLRTPERESIFTQVRLGFREGWA